MYLFERWGEEREENGGKRQNKPERNLNLQAAGLLLKWPQ